MKSFIILSCLSVLLSACATPAGNGTTGNATPAQQIGMTALKVAVNARCYRDLNQFAAWNTATRIMTAEQKQQLQSQVCGCVADKAPTATNALELTTAAIDPQARNTIAAQIVNRTVNACLAELGK